MDWLLAAFTTLFWLATATGLDPDDLPIPTVSPGQSIDLLLALGLHNTSLSGVTLADGPQQLRPAYYLQGDFRDLKLPPSEFQRVSDLVRHSHEFTISALLRQETGNTGSIFSIADGLDRFLELQSSGRRNEVRLHYTSRADSRVYVETFHYKLADNKWHHVALSISGSQAELFVDCHPLYKRLLRPGALDRNFTEPQQLWLGQRYKHYFFKGVMQDVRLIAGPHGYLYQCPKLDSACPTCGQFSLLQSTVQELTNHLKELSERLKAAEGRIARVEDCDCQKSCWVNGTSHADGARWQQGCDSCTCVYGEVQCSPIECPVLTCKKPVNKTGECCQICLRHCLFYGVFYDHGDQVHVKQCLACECRDGSMSCNKIKPEACPKLTCPPEQQFSVPGECCKFCPDIDECQQEGGLEGHHCHSNTKCVNTKGSYVCECLPGYRRVDKFNCAELDECSSGEHNCDPHADCINTQGSYHCVCQEGYAGDGYTCTPVCGQRCLNGGACKSPGQCVCPSGYIGSSCEKDVDECATNLHRCTKSSVCVNMMGWYYCACKAGYNSTFIDNNLGTLCQDINECNLNLHTCHPSSQCVNKNGSYECKCPPERGPDCRLDCSYEGVEYTDGLIFSPPTSPCVRCTCTKGIISCEEPKCNCSVPGSDKNKCCPQCNSDFSCSHQELTDVVFNHGERWSYQCQTCECLNGEVDCWDMKCPELPCKNPIQEPEDCCPRCGELCPMGNSTALSSGEPCPYAGIHYQSGAQFTDPSDPCVACNCQDGVLCCSYNLDCDDNARAVGHDGRSTDSNKQFSGGRVKVADSGDGSDSQGARGGGETTGG